VCNATTFSITTGRPCRMSNPIVSAMPSSRICTLRCVSGTPSSACTRVRAASTISRLHWTMRLRNSNDPSSASRASSVSR